MAGIGFVLRKLYQQDSLSSILGAGLHSTLASTGPWLFTVLSLGVISIVGHDIVSMPVIFDFRSILIYNFCFSVVCGGPIFMVATRYHADSIHKRDVSSASGMLLGALILMWALEIVIGSVFYFFYASLSDAMAISAVINLLLLSAVWLVSIFISALRNYMLISAAFLLGMAVAALASIGLAELAGSTGMLSGFSIGIATILAILLASTFAEYPAVVFQPFKFLSYFRRYWEIALGGLVFNMTIWVDKWIMWLAPEAIRLDNGLVMYPHYDSAMFIAYLTTIPAMALFLLHTETVFFERYIRFYQDIEQKAHFAKIQKNHLALVRSIFGAAGYFFLLQACIVYIGVLLAPEIVILLKGDYLQVGILRYGLAGAMFHMLTLFTLILLSYFDNRKGALLVQLLFLFTNALFTWISMKAGFTYYGYGYFLSAFITFVFSAILIVRHVSLLPYHTFITANASVHKAKRSG